VRSLGLRALREPCGPEVESVPSPLAAATYPLLSDYCFRIFGPHAPDDFGKTRVGSRPAAKQACANGVPAAGGGATGQQRVVCPGGGSTPRCAIADRERVRRLLRGAYNSLGNKIYRTLQPHLLTTNKATKTCLMLLLLVNMLYWFQAQDPLLTGNVRTGMREGIGTCVCAVDASLLAVLMLRLVA
jgi:hypothetical protein